MIASDNKKGTDLDDDEGVHEGTPLVELLGQEEIDWEQIRVLDRLRPGDR